MSPILPSSPFLECVSQPISRIGLAASGALPGPCRPPWPFADPPWSFADPPWVSRMRLRPDCSHRHFSRFSRFRPFSRMGAQAACVHFCSGSYDASPLLHCNLLTFRLPVWPFLWAVRLPRFGGCRVAFAGHGRGRGRRPPERNRGLLSFGRLKSTSAGGFLVGREIGPRIR